MKCSASHSENKTEREISRMGVGVEVLISGFLVFFFDFWFGGLSHRVMRLKGFGGLEDNCLMEVLCGSEKLESPKKERERERERKRFLLRNICDTIT